MSNLSEDPYYAVRKYVLVFISLRRISILLCTTLLINPTVLWLKVSTYPKHLVHLLFILSSLYFDLNSNVAAVTDKIKMRYEKFLDMVKTCDTANDSNFKDFRKGLSKDLRAADRVSISICFFLNNYYLFRYYLLWKLTAASLFFLFPYSKSKI